MRIAVITGQFPSTSETFVLNQIIGLIDRGHDVFIYAFHKGTQGQEHGLVRHYGLTDRTHYYSVENNKIKRVIKLAGKFVKHFPKHPLKILNAVNFFRHGRRALNLSELRACVFWIEHGTRSFDVIYCHFGPRGIIGANWRRSGYISGKLITVFHAYDLTRYVKEYGSNVYDDLFDCGDQFLAITAYAKEKLILLGCPEEKIIIHHMGVDCRYFPYLHRERSSGESLKVVAVGRMVEKKGFAYAIRAIAEVITQGYKIHCTFIGDGELRKDLENLVDSLGIQEEITFTGWRTQEQIVKILKQSHIMLVPSVTSADGDEEGLPVVLMEALAVGLPVITTRHAGIPELIENMKTGLLVEERDVNALVEKIGMLYENHKLYRALASQGRKKIEQAFNIDKLNDRLVQIFDRIVLSES